MKIRPLTFVADCAILFLVSKEGTAMKKLTVEMAKKEVENLVLRKASPGLVIEARLRIRDFEKGIAEFAPVVEQVNFLHELAGTGEVFQ